MYLHIHHSYEVKRGTFIFTYNYICKKKYWKYTTSYYKTLKTFLSLHLPWLWNDCQRKRMQKCCTLPQRVWIRSEIKHTWVNALWNVYCCVNLHMYIITSS